MGRFRIWIGRSGAVSQAGLMFCLLAPLELIIGSWWLHNAVIVSDGFHNAFDGPMLVVVGWAGGRLARSSRHAVHHTGRTALMLGVYVLTVVSIGLAPLLESTESAGFDQLIAGMVAGLAAGAINVYGFLRTRGPYNKANRLHFVSDFAASVIVGLSGVLGVLFESPLAITLSAWGIFVLVAATIAKPTVSTLRELLRSLRSSTRNCTQACATRQSDSKGAHSHGHSHGY